MTEYIIACYTIMLVWCTVDSFMYDDSAKDNFNLWLLSPLIAPLCIIFSAICALYDWHNSKINIKNEREL